MSHPGMNPLPMGNDPLPMGNHSLPYPFPFKGKGGLGRLRAQLMARARHIHEQILSVISVQEMLADQSRKIGGRIYLRITKNHKKNSAIPAVSIRWIYASAHREDGKYWVSADDLKPVLDELGNAGQILHANAMASNVLIAMLRAEYDALYSYLPNLEQALRVIHDEEV